MSEEWTEAIKQQSWFAAGFNKQWDEYNRILSKITHDLNAIYACAITLHPDRVWSEVIRYPTPNSETVAAFRARVEGYYRGKGLALNEQEADMLFANFFTDLHAALHRWTR